MISLLSGLARRVGITWETLDDLPPDVLSSLRASVPKSSRPLPPAESSYDGRTSVGRPRARDEGGISVGVQLVIQFPNGEARARLEFRSAWRKVINNEIGLREWWGILQRAGVVSEPYTIEGALGAILRLAGIPEEA